MKKQTAGWSAVLLLVPLVALGIALLPEPYLEAQEESAEGAEGFQELPLRRVDPELNSALNQARSLLQQSATQKGQKRLPALNEILGLDLGDSAEAKATLLEAHLLMAEALQGSPAKQIACWKTALELTDEPGEIDQLASRIERAASLPGASASIGAFPEGESSLLDLGPDDTCLGAVPVTVVPGSPYSETMSITPAGDHNWRTFDVTGSEGWAVRIETISDFPGTFSDDTDLALWDGCPEEGGTLLAFNDDKPGDFTSLIQTDCVLHPGSYYVEVGGFFDIATPDNFDFEIEVTETCEIPEPDEFEPDDVREQATRIGLPTSTPPHANGWGRTRKDIQAHSIFPSGDRDHVAFRLTRNELVRMKTAAQLPTFFNDFEASDPLDNPDTVLDLFYENEKDYGGRCNDPDNGFPTVCFEDADCSDLSNPLPGFPDCIPLCLFNVPFACDENPLAVNDDVGGGDFGSELALCLPRNSPQSDSLSADDHWIVRTDPWSASDVFEYELGARNEATCIFEQEPNGGFDIATPLTLGDTVHGIFEFSETIPFQDADLWSFDVEGDSLVTLETDGYNNLAVDTFLQLIVGPNDTGSFFLVAQDEDGGTGFLSRLELILPVADDLLGNTTADADYYINVTSSFLNPNFPYTLHTSAAPPPLLESEPNDDCATNANAVALGEQWRGEINPTCDFDTYKFTLAGDTQVAISSPSGGDSAIELRDCSDDSKVACDDDGGPGLLPLLEGCLPAGEYCAKVRAFSSAATFAYDVEFTDNGSCDSGSDPPVMGDGAFTCLDFDTCP